MVNKPLIRPFLGGGGIGGGTLDSHVNVVIKSGFPVCQEERLRLEAEVQFFSDLSTSPIKMPRKLTDYPLAHGIHGTNGIFTHIWLIFMVNVGKF